MSHFFRLNIKAVLETTKNDTACMKCKQIAGFADNAHCEKCKNWWEELKNNCFIEQLIFLFVCSFM